MRYTAILKREANSGFVAIIPALPGCVSLGNTREEAIANIREAAQLNIEDDLASGDPLPTEAGKEFVN